jgi:fibronectin-binding autotransporter adhesin
MANRFWVGGAATWDATAGSKWATTSGGVGGSAVPTAADDVFLDNGAGTGNVTLSSSSVCRSLNCTGYVNTLTHPTATTLTIGDGTAGASNIALKLVAGMTYTLGGSTTAAITFVSTSATIQTIDQGGKTCGNMTFQGAGSSYQLTSSSTISVGATVTLTSGTLNTNGQTCSWGFFALGVGTKTLTLGSSTINIIGTSGTPWNASTNGANFTLNANTSSIVDAVNASTTFAGNGLTYNNLSITGSSTKTMSGANTFNNLTRSSTVAGSQGLVVQSDIVVSGVFTCTGTYSGTQAVRIFLGSAQFASAATGQRTITVNGSVSFTNVDFHYILAAGTAGTWTGTSMGDAGNNSNITFDVSRNLYWFGTANNWVTLNRWFTATGGGGTSNTAPLPQDNVFIDANSGVAAAGSFNTSLRILGTNVDFTGVTNSPNYNFGGFNPGIMGNMTWGSSMTIINSATASLTFLGTTAATLTNNSVTHPSNFAVGIIVAKNSPGSLTFQDAVDTSIGQLNLQSGTLNTNGKSVSCNNLVSAVSATRVLTLGSSTITLTGTGTIWSISQTGFTLNANTSTIVISDTSATGKTLCWFFSNL